MKKLVLTTFSTFSRISEAVFGIIKMVEKVVLANFSHHFREKKLRGKSGKGCQNQLFPRLKPFWRPKSLKKLVLPTFSTFSPNF